MDWVSVVANHQRRGREGVALLAMRRGAPEEQALEERTRAELIRLGAGDPEAGDSPTWH